MKTCKQNHPWRFLMITIVAGSVFMASLPLFAQALVNPDPNGPWYKQIQVDTFWSASYNYDFNRPDDDVIGYRVFQTEDNRVKLDVASFTIQKAAPEAGDFGFRVDMGAGQSQPGVTAASGFFRNAETGDADQVDVEQLYVTYVADVGRGLTFDLGKFYAPIGYESVERYDAINNNATNSLLFGFCGPFTSTGLKVSYPFTDKVSGMLMVVQGWDNVKDNNSGKSVEAQLNIAPSEDTSYCFSYMAGPEQNDSSNRRDAFDFCALWQASPEWGFGFNFDYGHEKDALGMGMNGTWYGFAGYASYNFTDNFKLSFRAEQFNDSDGARTGTDQTLREVTITPSYNIGKHFIIRGDLRKDWSGESTFPKRDRFADNQTTATVNLLFVF